MSFKNRMADGKKVLKCRSVFVIIMIVPINTVKTYVYGENEIVDVLHLLRRILFYLRSFYSTVHPDEGHGL